MSRESQRHANAVANRLSLREPLRESLHLLDRVSDLIRLDKSQDVAAALETLSAEFPELEDFERDFPSLCFAIATGVGKTRLMAAFAAYLHRAHGIRHFFILAPNLTIYEKLISDFAPGHDKYVFQGIAEFAQNPPEIITGDNYESGRGVRRDREVTSDMFGRDQAIHINIFNVSKINTEVRGGRSPRIKRLSEYIGQSYFEYLSDLDDLVLMMDESHRYRASAGVAAINELKPVLGLELTATPRVESGGGQEFRNVVYRYPLSAAMDDGYVKEPAVATRENFDKSQYTDVQLERLKLEDGVRVHEDVKVELEVYARQNGKPVVKPFMLVVATDTTHADDLVRQIQADDFFGGAYRDKVIQVHSNQRGEEKEETIERLLKVQSAAEPTEIVVHVNKLKEGWDVNNLFTIVPLRAAKSQILTEQTIGRGLRLPYGQRTGVAAVDRLTIIAHDQFQAIIDEANKPDSIIRKGVVIGKDVAEEPRKTVTVAPVFTAALFGEAADSDAPPVAAGSSSPESTPVFLTARERDIGRATLAAVKRYETLSGSGLLLGSEVRQKIADDVRSSLPPYQRPLEGVDTDDADKEPDIEQVVKTTLEYVVHHSIDIPRVIVLPKGEVHYEFTDFDLDCRNISMQPVSVDILIEHLRNRTRHYLSEGDSKTVEPHPENYIVRALLDFDDISYDHHAALLYKLAGQVVAHLRSYLPDEDAVLNVLQYHQKNLAGLVHTQMQPHYHEAVTEYEALVSSGFTTLTTATYGVPENENVRDYRQQPRDLSRIRQYLFGGFKRCLYPVQRFDSDTERQFAVLLEKEREELKWLKPADNTFQIRFSHEAPPYEPDFVVETDFVKYLCEPKRADQIQTDIVQAKARAAVEWCEHASRHEAETASDNVGKPWRYLLIPHDAITATVTLKALSERYEVKPTD
ncbi:type III restriction enzyme, res subunit [Salinisphaera dokdonensis CL-ES53]|uniref:Type III restriction enzyme, res subunit n=1 Tax=Salinisphaera dokdonensis CL-ES53 TaxID=1304272 RepID=A0ABV2AYZ6_9GAMM